MDDTRILSKHDARQLAVEVKDAITKAVVDHEYLPGAHVSISDVLIEIVVHDGMKNEKYKYNWGLN